MTSKNKTYLLLGTICLLTTILFVGQFYDPEDGDRSFFIKYRPTFKQYFYSPIAFHRFLPKKLTLVEEIEENAFQDFIVNREQLKNNNNFFLVSTILIQTTLTLLTFSLYSLISKKQ